MKQFLLALSCSIALAVGLAAEEQELPGGPVLNAEQIEALSDEMVTGSTEAVVPEPSSTFFAGLGGLALLFFVLRRRPTY